MVVLHYKRSDLNQFLFQATTDITIDALTAELVASKYKFPLNELLLLPDI